MSSKQPVKFVLGTHMVGDSTRNPGIAHFDSIEDVQALLDAFHSRSHNAHLDTARNYQGAEERLGRAGHSFFTIDTKVKSGTPGDHEPDKIAASIAASLADLGVSSVETLYLHMPDRQTPFEDAARAMDVAFRQGIFKRFGLSNYSADEVRRFVDICHERGYVKPSVYQGHYNAVVRGAEEDLIPFLREHGISFYAYSSAAGGLFRAETETSPNSARWSESNPAGALYKMLYGKPLVQKAVSSVREAAQAHGISGHAAAVRWTAFHSVLDGQYGDAILFSASSVEQLHRTFDALEAGPLPEDLAQSISAIYASLEGSGPPYCI
ncbi:Aldo/keto reductase [Poronia punctata]|nr:Aldo/keto reductase [Poronia punctata]